MRKILVTGGTVFVSRYVASYFAARGDDVYCLNRGSRQQCEGTAHIRADRNSLGDALKGFRFDAVLDVTAYNRADIENLLDSQVQFSQYIFISSSAVYPETLPQPFREEYECGANSIWGSYGINKIEAERVLHQRVPQAYILRPPYLYGEMQNIYREPFVFECIESNRPFYVPGDGSMRMQFFHVHDLCRFIEILLEQQPDERVFNVGNAETVDIKTWADLCAQAMGRTVEKIYVSPQHKQRDYFPFYPYEYTLDVSRQRRLMSETMPLSEGLCRSYEWYRVHRDEVLRKPLIDYIDQNILS